jgi:TM2 domain-containing membrane protein YozV
MKLLLLSLAGALLVFSPGVRAIKAQDRVSEKGFGVPIVASGAAMDDSLALRRLTAGSAVQSGVAKNPELAAALSVLVPGLGQVYNGEVLKGAAVMASFLGSIAVCIGVKIGGTHDSIGTKGWIGVGMVATSYLWGITDASMSAARINRERSGGTPHSLLEFHAGDHAISFTAGISLGGINAGVCFGI